MMTRMVWIVLLATALASPCLASYGERSLLFENFQSVSAPALPAGWVGVNPAGDDGMWVTRSVGGVRWGVQCLRYTSSATQPADDWFFTAAVNLQAGVPCGFRYMIRAGASGAPLSVEVFAGTAQTPGSMLNVVKPLYPVLWTSYAADSGSFVPPASGTYYIGFHVIGGPAGTRLDVDDVNVTIPETDLRLTLGMSAELEQMPLVFSASDTMEACVYIENGGTSSPLVNKRFAVGRWPSSAELDFNVVGPAGRLPIINLFAKLGDLTVSNFVALPPGEIVGKALNLWGWYQFDLPGDYTIEVYYRNFSDPTGLGAWQGTLVSDPLTITIQ